MANPITWRNVDAPHVDEAMRGFAWAGNSINTGFDNFTTALKQNEANNQAVWQQGKDANTAAYLDELRKYRTPEELQAAQQGGALDALKQRFGQQVDLNRIGTETDNRVPLLQTRGKAAIDFATAQRNEAQRPLREQAMNFVADGDVIGLKLFQAEHPDIPLADLYAKADEMRRAGVTEQRAGQEWEQKQKLFPWQVKEAEAKVKNEQQELDVKRAQAEMYRAQAGSTGKGKGDKPEGFSTEQKRFQESLKGTDYESGAALSDDGIKAIALAAKDMGEDAQAGWKAVQEVLRTTDIGVPIPASAVLRSISAGHSYLFGDARNALKAEIEKNKDVWREQYKAIANNRANLVDGVPTSGASKDDADRILKGGKVSPADTKVIDEAYARAAATAGNPASSAVAASTPAKEPVKNEQPITKEAARQTILEDTPIPADAGLSYPNYGETTPVSRRDLSKTIRDAVKELQQGRGMQPVQGKIPNRYSMIPAEVLERAAKKARDK